MKLKEIIIGCILNVVFFKCLPASTVVMCMSWYTEMGKLVLTCKVSNMEYRVEIINQRTTSKSYCSQKSCSKGANSTVDALTNVTTVVVTVSNTSEINNDTWTCKHGTGRENTSVNVIIYQDQHTQCADCTEHQWKKALAGFFGSLVVTCIVYVTVAAKRDCQFKDVFSRFIKRARKSVISMTVVIIVLNVSLMATLLLNCKDRGILLIVCWIPFALQCVIILIKVWRERN